MYIVKNILVFTISKHPTERRPHVLECMRNIYSSVCKSGLLNVLGERRNCDGNSQPD